MNNCKYCFIELTNNNIYRADDFSFCCTTHRYYYLHNPLQSINKVNKLIKSYVFNNIR